MYIVVDFLWRAHYSHENVSSMILFKLNLKSHWQHTVPVDVTGCRDWLASLAKIQAFPSFQEETMSKSSGWLEVRPLIHFRQISHYLSHFTLAGYRWPRVSAISSHGLKNGYINAKQLFWASPFVRKANQVPVGIVDYSIFSDQVSDRRIFYGEIRNMRCCVTVLPAERTLSI